MVALGLIAPRGGNEPPPFPGYFNYDVTRYQSTHVQGGAIVAKSPGCGVVNMHQQHWDISSRFVIGASTFPNSGAANPTPTILALTYRAAEAIVDK